MEKINIKHEFWKLMGGLGYIFAIILTVRALNWGKWGVIAILCISSLIMKIFALFIKR